MRDSPLDRRKVLLASGAAAASLAGCISTSPTPPGDAGSDSDGSGNDDTNDGGNSVQPLSAGGSSTVYPIVSGAASVWKANRPAGDEDYWQPSEYGIQTDENLAEYWGGLYGFDGGSGAPYSVTVGLSHSGTGLEKLKDGRTDIGNASAPVSAELPEADESTLEKFANHVVGVDAQPIVVSKQIYDAGVTKLTAEQVRKIYRDEITNWSEIPSYSGPDRSIQAVGRAEGSGTDTAFRKNLLGDPKAPMPGIDVRKGQNQKVKSLVEKSDNAIAYMALAFVGGDVETITLTFDGTEYVPGENLADEDYPLSRDLHCYTWEGTSKKEAAFLRLMLSDYGQQNFVEPEGYSKLTKERQKNQIDKLPAPEQ